MTNPDKRTSYLRKLVSAARSVVTYQTGEKTKTICSLGLAVIAGSVALGNDLETVRTNLEKQVGGKWQVETNAMWRFVCPKELPPTLHKGTYNVFVDLDGKTSRELAQTWTYVCQAPIFTLGTNAYCTVVTYVSRRHPVSKAIIKALGLKEPPDNELREKNDAPE